MRSVHQAYMRRARSVTDYLNAMHYHIQGFRLYLTRLDEDEMTRAGMQKLAEIDRLVDELRNDFKSHPDKRSNVLQDNDVERKS